MRSLFLWIWIACGRFWHRRTGDALGRFAQSKWFPLVANLAWFAGLLLLMEAGSRLPAEATLSAQLALLTVIVVWMFFAPLFFLSWGSVVRSSSSYTDDAGALLNRCKGVLERCGFSVRHLRDDSLRATRGRLLDLDVFTAEKEWRTVPILVLVQVTPANGTTVLDVECVGTGDFGIIGRIGQPVFADTCRAIAQLDGQSLNRLDRQVPQRQGILQLGGFAGNIFNATAVCAFVSVAILAGLSIFALPRMLEVGMGGPVYDLVDARWRGVTNSLDVPERLELEHYLDGLSGTTEDPARVLAAFRPIAGADSLVVALRSSDSAYTVLHPATDAPLRKFAEAIFVADNSDDMPSMQKVGDRVFRRFAEFRLRDFARQLGLKENDVVAGVLLSLDEAERRVPSHPNWSNSAGTIYCRGDVVLHIDWRGDRAVVSSAASALPQDIMRSTLVEESGELTWREYFMIDPLPWTHALYREEERSNGRYWVSYFGVMRQDGWCGFALAQPATLLDDSRSTFTSGAKYIGVAALILIYLFVYAYSLWAGKLISKPVLELRDKLRAIADGDYSVRIESKRADEIGQLQELLNYTAVELQKRESIKELMGKYLSRQVADRIMADDSETTLAGVRREVTVLFADVRGFTSYSEKHAPEQVTRSLNEYFEVMVDVIASHEGVLDKFLGDGLMVVFGAPVTQPDHERRAVDTALEMQAALQSLNLKRAQRGDEPIAIGIGINSGIAISGNLGSLKRMEFTVIGDTVNTAARLESSAKQGQILIGRATYEKVKDLIECEPLGQITVKGKSEPVDIWWLKGIKPRRG